jgi:hypothetical protein
MARSAFSLTLYTEGLGSRNGVVSPQMDRVMVNSRSLSLFRPNMDEVVVNTKPQPQMLTPKQKMITRLFGLQVIGPGIKSLIGFYGTFAFRSHMT